MGAVLAREKFYYMHVLRCGNCLKDWVEELPNTSKQRRFHVLEEIVQMNHPDSTTIK